MKKKSIHRQVIIKVLLTVLLGVTATATYAQGNALDFDGTDDYVSVSNGSGLISGASEFMIEAWVYARNSAPVFPDFDGFFGFRNDTDCDFYLVQTASNSVEFRLRNSSGTTYNLTSGSLQVDTWQHWAIVYDGSDIILYLDGVQEASTTASGTITNSTETLNIGLIKFSAFDFYSDAVIDELRVWTTARTASEIQAAMNRTLKGNETGLVAYYPFDEGTPGGTNTGITTLPDLLGSSDGTLNNFALSGSSSNWITSTAPVVSSLGNGPGGVGDTTGTSSLVLWLDAADLDADSDLTDNPEDGEAVDSWTDLSGNGNEFTMSGTNRPLYSTSGDYNAVYFDSESGTSKYMELPASAEVNPGTVYVILNVEEESDASSAILDNSTSSLRFNQFFDSDKMGFTHYGVADHLSSISSVYDEYVLVGYNSDGTGNLSILQNDQSETLSIATSAGLPYNTIGINHTVADLTAYITEIAVFDEVLSSTEQILIENYLSARYGSPDIPYDYYTMDDTGSGDYDYQVAGIGQVSASDNLDDSRGSGIVRISNATDLDDGEFLFWGHDGEALDAIETEALPTEVEARISRTWRVSETAEVGNLDIDLDLSETPGSITASDLRLLIDTDNDNDFSDETSGGGGVIEGAVNTEGNLYQFADIDLDDGQRFTLGTIDLAQTSLTDISVVPADSLVLVGLYNDTNGSGWTNNTNWLSGPVSSWYGITVSGKRVAGIDLNNNGLTGNIPAELADLSNLQFLSLYNNALDGSIPSELGDLSDLFYLYLHENQLSGSIPPELGDLSNLIYLYLYSNQLSGSIPPELGDLSGLEILSLNNNELDGSIPPELGDLSNLIYLYLYSNQLSGSIPPELGDLSNLIYLYLNENQLTGSIPPELGDLPGLEILSLNDNGLSGSIPSELGSLSNLTILYLYDNELSGSIPPELGDLSNLLYLVLSENQLSGAIPSELGSLSNLLYLYLYSNQLSGSIPSELGDLSNLTVLYLYSNQLSGAIPSELGDLSGLTHLQLQSNQLSGSIPSELGDLSDLTILSLRDNELSGSIPSELGSLSNLTELYLYSNQLSSAIPSELGDLSNLTHLELQSNQLSGSIPSELGDLSNLTILSLPDNELSGAIPSELGDLFNLTGLYLHSNQLSGSIPPELGDLSNLQFLSLFDNTLSGSIPSELGSLSNLIYLYLSDNELSGTIPSELGDLSNLTELYLYDNQLSGSIPSELGDLSNLTELHLYSNQLSGAIPPDLGDLSNLQVLSLRDNELSGSIPSELGSLSNLTELYLYSNQLSGAIPSELGDLSNLQTLSLFDNTLTGSIPPELGDLSNLMILSLRDNELSGAIPSELGDLLNLTVLYLHENQLSGSIPSELGDLSNLTQLYLYSNQLSGVIPPELGDLSNLQVLSLRDNELSGSIPSELGDLSNLTQIHLYSNQLSGVIPPELGDLSNLQVLSLRDNELSGSIPSELGDLSNLTQLHLYSNQLSGVIPPELGNLSNLQVLSLRDNELSGSIPSELGDLSNLTQLHLYSNQLSGAIPPELGDLSNLTELYLYDNQLSGSIPSELGDLSNLTQLHLYSNQLSGAIPPELGDLSNLTELYLYDNQLSGSIPSELGSLSNLTHMHLYSNQLSGAIPSELGDLSNLTGLYLNSNQLSGSIPSELGELSNLISLYLNDNQLSGAVPAEVASLLAIEAMTLQNNRLTSLPDFTSLASLTELRVENNHLTFGGLESNAGLSATFTYSPQDTLYGERQFLGLSPGDDLTLSATSDGTSDVYQWRKDSTEISGATDSTYFLNSVSSEDAGSYDYLVNSSLLPDLVLGSAASLVMVTPSQKDSLALVALYEQTHGEDWVNNSNWLTGTLDTWAGVTVSGGRVTVVDLSNNNLEGTLPSSLGFLTELERLSLHENQLSGSIPDELSDCSALMHLYLHDNHLSGAVPSGLSLLSDLEALSVYDNNLSNLPDLSGLSELSILWVENNYFTFDDLEPNKSLIDAIDFQYAPQQAIGYPRALSPGLGETVSFTVSGGGTVSQYQWYKDELPVTDATDSVYLIDSYAEEDAGLYVSEVTNDSVPGLTLRSEVISVGSFSGEATDSLALVALYYTTDGPRWNENSGWLSNDLEDWYGVALESERVVSLDLSNNNLEGYLPEEIGSLDKLVRLAVGGNLLEGEVPGEVTQLTSLEGLFLQDNLFSDLPDLSSSPPDTLWAYDNRFTFEDLEPNTGISHFQYAPQAEVGESFSKVLAAGNGIVLSVDVAGDSNQYQWYKDDSPISGADETIYAITGMSASDEGVYTCSITNGVVSDLTISRRPVSLFLEVSRQDSLALVSLYQSTEGRGWTDDSGWLSAPVSTWYGVSVSSGRVVSVDLSNNALEGVLPDALGALDSLQHLSLSGNTLSGFVPEELTGLSALRSLTLDGNQLAGLPDLSSLDLATLWVHDNRFTFGDLEPLAGFISTIDFQYSPQAGIGETERLSPSIGKDVTLTVDTEGDFNHYQWQRDASDIASATASRYTITNYSAADEGVYQSLVTNSKVPDLTLVRAAITIEELSKEDSLVLAAINENRSKDSLAVVTLYEETGGTEWHRNGHWLTGKLSSWYGIELENGRVVELYLANNNLTGSLPPVLGSLDELRVLYLSGNAIEGTIPEELGRLEKLSVLYLSDNQLTGNIPSGFSALENLKVLDVSHNALSGTLPDAVAGLPKLQSLFVHDNLLDDLPSLSSLSNLSTLWVQDNGLDFEDLERNTSLLRTLVFQYAPQAKIGYPRVFSPLEGDTISFSVDGGGALEEYQWQKDSVNIKGATDSTYTLYDYKMADAGVYVPLITHPVFSSLTLEGEPVYVGIFEGLQRDSLALIALYNTTDGPSWTVNDHWLSGSVDTWYGVEVEADRVVGIKLPNNNLEGAIPPEIGLLENLETLDLSGNLISGSLPVQLDRLSAMVNLRLSNNGLSGSLPFQMGVLENLREVELSDNRLSGPVPASWGNLSELTLLDLSNNQLEGSLPGELSQLSRLITLQLSDNAFENSIPPEWVSLERLETLDLSGNRLSGSIPLTRDVFRNLRVLNISDNQLSGILPEATGTLVNLRELDLSGNLLEGVLPDALGELNALEALKLDNNEFSGVLPEALGILGRLQALSLAANQFDGNIPASLGQLTSLEELSLAGNRLNGSIPASLGGLLQLRRMNLSANELIGDLPEEMGALSSLQALNVSDNLLEGLPDLSSLPQLVTLWVEDNRLDFEDLEANDALIGSIDFRYAPQARVGYPRGMSPATGDTVTVSVSTGGSFNRYQWERDDQDITNAIESNYTLYHYQPSDSGSYVCRIMNAEVPGLILESEPTVLGLFDSSALDSLALVALYYTTNGPNWDTDDHWLDSPLEAWHGVTLQDGRVRQLDLNDNNLQGVVPPEIEALEELTSLNVGNNFLIGDLPEETARLSSLRGLYLQYNQLSGLPGLTSMAALDTLWVQENRLDFEDLEPNVDLVGNIDFRYAPQAKIGQQEQRTALVEETIRLSAATPGSANRYQWQKDDADIAGAVDTVYTIASYSGRDEGEYSYQVSSSIVPGLVLEGEPVILTSDIKVDSLALVALYAATNGAGWAKSELWLTGNLSEWEGVVVEEGRVREVFLSNNNLDGTLPSRIGDLTRVRTLYLSGNQLGGQIPETLGNMKQLTELELSDNQLGGEIPASLENLASLRILSFKRNELEGYIPAVIGSMSSLQFLDLSGNTLEGSIPDRIGDLSFLQWLYLHDNALNGELPIALTRLGQLQELDMSGNRLEGQIPPEMGGLATLVRLDLSENRLEGEIPASLGQLTRLKELSLRSDSLGGAIPPELGNLSNLRTLDLSDNYLEGEVPPSLAGASGMQQLLLSGNRLSGTFPTALYEIAALQVLSLRENALDSLPPVKAGQLPSLTRLQVSGNALSSFPDLSGPSVLPALEVLTILQNYLSFEDIEPNLASATLFLYAPQYTRPRADTLTLGEDFELSPDTKGTANRYLWRAGTGMLDNTDATLRFPQVTLDDAGEYSVQVNSDIVTDLTLLYDFRIEVVPAKPGVEDPPPYCSGNNMFVLTATGVQQADSVIWYHSLPISPEHRIKAVTAQDPSIGYELPEGKDLDTLYLTAKFRGIESLPDTVWLAVRPIIVRQGNNLIATGPQAKRYEWYLQGRLLQDVEGPVLPMAPGTEQEDYSVRVITEQGCSAIAGRIGEVIVAIPDDRQNRSLQVYPNPTEQYVNVRWNSVYIGEVIIALKDVSGRNIKTQSIQKTQEELQLKIDLSAIRQGVYMIEIYSAGKKVDTQILIKQ